LSYEQAWLLATMVEVGLCNPDAGVAEVARLPESPLYAANEIRAALAWTGGAADQEHDFAETLVLRMPAVFTTLEADRICRREVDLDHDALDVLPPSRTVEYSRWNSQWRDLLADLHDNARPAALTPLWRNRFPARGRRPTVAACTHRSWARPPVCRSPRCHRPTTAPRH
jgi:hypothetical protein